MKKRFRRGLVVGNIAVSEAALLGKPEIAESSENLRKEVRAALEATGRFTVRANAKNSSGEPKSTPWQRKTS